MCHHDAAAAAATGPGLGPGGVVRIDDSRSSSSSPSSWANYSRSSCYSSNSNDYNYNYNYNYYNNRCMICACSTSPPLQMTMPLLSMHHPHHEEEKAASQSQVQSLSVVQLQSQSQVQIQSFASTYTSSRLWSSTSSSSSPPPSPTGGEHPNLDAAASASAAAAAAVSGFVSLLLSPAATTAVAAVLSSSISSSSTSHAQNILQRDCDNQPKRTHHPEKKERPPPKHNVRFCPSIDVIEIERYTTEREKNARWYTSDEMDGFRTTSKRLIKEMSRLHRTDEEMFELWGILSKDTVRAKKKSIRAVQNCMRLLNVIEQNQKTKAKEVTEGRQMQDTKINEENEGLSSFLSLSSSSSSSSSAPETSTASRSWNEESTIAISTTRRAETTSDATNTIAEPLLSSGSVISSVLNENNVAKQLLLCAYSLESNACAERAKNFALMVQKNQLQPLLLLPSSSSTYLEKVDKKKKKRRKQQKRKQYGQHSVWKKQKFDVPIDGAEMDVAVTKKKQLKTTDTATIDHIDTDMTVVTMDTDTNRSKLVVVYS